MRAAPVRHPPRIRREWLAAAVLAGLAGVVFAGALGGEFVSLDDPAYVTRNPNVSGGLSPAGVCWAFTSFDNFNWHPLTWLSLQLDASLWGQKPWGYHLTNVLLHAANAALLFVALRALTGAFWRSAAAALLFAVHPLRVESVAWVSERKDVLSVFFGLLALWAYAGYAAAPGRRRYLAVAGLFVLSLLCKPMLVTLPFLLLVLDWWPLGRWPGQGTRALVLEKLPLVALTVASSFVTYLAQAHEGAVQNLETYPPLVRFENAAFSYVFYLGKTAWPTGLALFYPHPGAALPPWRALAAVALLVAVTAGAVVLRRRAPYLLAGWLWYLGTLVPVIGIVQVGAQAYADRYTYFPQVGLLVALSWGVADLAGKRSREALIAAAAVTAVLAFLTHKQVEVWHDSAVLWEHALRVTDPNPTAHLSLGAALERRGQVAEAEEHYRAALELDPTSVLGLASLGGLLATRGNLEEAGRLLDEACRRAPWLAQAHTYRGNVYFRQGKLDDAAREHEEATRLDPELGGAYFNLAGVEVARQHYDEAVKDYREALRLWPDFASAHAGLGAVLLRQGRYEEALPHLRSAVAADPRSADNRMLLGNALEAGRDPEAAAGEYDRATRINPGLAAAWFRLGMVRARQGRAADAEFALSKAVEREAAPDYCAALAAVLDALAGALAADGHQADAVATERRAREMADTARRPDLVSKIEEHLRHYEKGGTGRPPGGGP
jgi:tetratricopeptide (TPR) repeat protein